MDDFLRGIVSIKLRYNNNNNNYYSYETKIFTLNDNSTHVNSFLKESNLKECSNAFKIFYLFYLFNNYILFDDCKIREGSQKNDSSSDEYLNLISSFSEDKSLTTILPSESSYLSSIIDSPLISTFISSIDSSSSYTEIIRHTDSINISNNNIITNKTNQYNYTDEYIYSDLSYYSHTTDYSGLNNYSNISNEINSTTNIGKKFLENEISLDKNDIINNIPKIINAIEIGKNYEIEGEDYTLLIRPISGSHFPN